MNFRFADMVEVKSRHPSSDQRIGLFVRYVRRNKTLWVLLTDGAGRFWNAKLKNILPYKQLNGSE